MGLDEKTVELVAVGASVTAGCQHCLDHHADKARRLGALEEEITDAIAAGRMVRGGSAALMDEYLGKLPSGGPSWVPPGDGADPSGEAKNKEGD